MTNLGASNGFEGKYHITYIKIVQLYFIEGSAIHSTCQMTLTAI